MSRPERLGREGIVMGKLPRTGRVEAVVSASPEKVWGVLTDIGRTGEWSHETRGGEWLGSATGPQPGARFRGLNGKQFDGNGNYTFGLTEQAMFHEIDQDKIDRVRGMDITVVTTAKTDDEGRAPARHAPKRNRVEAGDPDLELLDRVGGRGVGHERAPLSPAGGLGCET